MFHDKKIRKISGRLCLTENLSNKYIEDFKILLDKWGRPNVFTEKEPRSKWKFEELSAFSQNFFVSWKPCENGGKIYGMMRVEDSFLMENLKKTNNLSTLQVSGFLNFEKIYRFYKRKEPLYLTSRFFLFVPIGGKIQIF